MANTLIPSLVPNYKGLPSSFHYSSLQSTMYASFCLTADDNEMVADWNSINSCLINTGNCSSPIDLKTFGGRTLSLYHIIFKV